MRFKETLSCFLLITGSILTTLQAQNLKIYYNLFNDSLTYKMDGEVVTEPRIRNGQEIELFLTEFNSFIYEIELEVKQENAQTSSGIMEMAQFAGLNPGLPGLGMGIGGERVGTSGGLGLLETPLITINDNAFSLIDLFTGSRGAEKMVETTQLTMNEIVELKEEIAGLLHEIRSFERSQEVAQLALITVDSLKSKPNLKPSFIKQRCQEYYNAIFLPDGHPAYSLDELLVTQLTPTRYDNVVKQLNARETTLGQKIGLLKGLNDQFANMNQEEAEFQDFLKDLRQFLLVSEAFDSELKEALSHSNSLNRFPNNQDLVNLQFKLAEILSNDFMYHTRIKAHSDIININIKMFKKNSNKDDDDNIIRSRHLRLETRGGLKITASVGLNFSRFLDPGHTYSVRDNVIYEDNAGVFSPAATSFLHFYRYSGKGVSLGGSFGIGFPMLTSDTENQSIQFFVGPSLIFGTTQRLILNFGLMGGRVTRLARGYQPGDEFDINYGDIPTRNPYEIGFFVGTSFNLGAN